MHPSGTQKTVPVVLEEWGSIDFQYSVVSVQALSFCLGDQGDDMTVCRSTATTTVLIDDVCFTLLGAAGRLISCPC